MLPSACSPGTRVGPGQCGARGSLQPDPEPGVVPLGIPAASSEGAGAGPASIRAEATAGEDPPAHAAPAS
eukprot:9130762-Heterocapsa_arctica.AAC.1